jgi:hypothetical protein
MYILGRDFSSKPPDGRKAFDFLLRMDTYPPGHKKWVVETSHKDLPVFSISSVLTNNDIKRIKALNH